MSKFDYSPPVDQLLAYRSGRGYPWPNYLELGFTKADVPELIRMALDLELNSFNYKETLTVWAPLHAWRTLGQLQAEEAAEPLLDLLDQFPEDDWVLEELPVVFDMMGPGIIPVLSDYLMEPLHELYSHVAVTSGLEKIGKQYPNARDECVAVFVKALEEHRENNATLNGFIISSLIDLKAVETAPLIEQAFDAETVDESIAGDLEEVLYELGIGPKPPPKESSALRLLFDAWLERDRRLQEAQERQKRRGEQPELDILEDDDGLPAYPTSFSQAKHKKKRKPSKQAKKKAKRKMQKKARKRNRRR